MAEQAAAPPKRQLWQPDGEAAQGPRLILGAKQLGEEAASAGAGGQGGRSEGRSPSVVKLVSERWEFLGLGAAAQKGLSENHDFVVVSVIGPQGSGKSLLLNHVASAFATSKPEEQGVVSLSHVPPPPRGLPRKPFTVAARDVTLEAAHQTVGVDMHVTSERLVLLDCQPLLSPSVALDMTLEGAPLPPHARSHEHLMELQSLHLAAFALSVSSVVIVVDDPVDSLVPSLLRTAHAFRPDTTPAWAAPPSKDAKDRDSAKEAEQQSRPRDEYSRDLGHLKKQSQPPASGEADDSMKDGEGPEAKEGAEVAEARPHIVFAYSQLADDWMEGGGAQQIEAALWSQLQETSLAATQAAPWVRPMDGCALNGEPRFNMFLLPRDERAFEQGESAFSLVKRACYTSYVDTLVKGVLSMPRRPFPRPVTEREWCRTAAKIWDMIGDSKMMSDYAAATESQYATG